ncbi:hypothetical protein, partial [Colwellia echini]
MSKSNFYEAIIAKLVEHHVAKSKVNVTTYVEESSLVNRSNFSCYTKKILLVVSEKEYLRSGCSSAGRASRCQRECHE